MFVEVNLLLLHLLKKASIYIFRQKCDLTLLKFALAYKDMHTCIHLFIYFGRKNLNTVLV